MKCPNCGKKTSGKLDKCPFCGADTASGDKGGGKLLLKKKDKTARVIEVKTIDEPSDGAAVKRGLNPKLMLIASAAVLIIILVIIIVTTYHSAEGERYAEAAYEYIGRNVADLNAANDKIFYSDGSAYAGVNSALRFDYVAESEGSVRAGGVKYPKWAVTLTNEKNGGFIREVTYTDFTVIKGDTRGIKTDGVISLDRFDEGEKKSTVLKAIDPRPYSISCSQTGIILYTYKYWYKLDNGDEQAAILRVGFSEKGDYKYSTTELLIPQYM